MSEGNKHHIVKYRTYLYVLLGLLTFTGLSVLVTSVELGPLAVVAALIFASFKSTLVLIYFMHLKFDNRIYTAMVSLVLFVFLVLIVITFFDYRFR
jgi:cytochrome c oxidase subunit 4